MYIALATNTVLYPAVFCLITHFNLKEIEQRRWDDIVCYGLAQAWCFYVFAGAWSILVAISWVAGVFLSNIGVFPRKSLDKHETHRLSWEWVELIQGATIGLMLSL